MSIALAKGPGRELPLALKPLLHAERPLIVKNLTRLRAVAAGAASLLGIGAVTATTASAAAPASPRDALAGTPPSQPRGGDRGPAPDLGHAPRAGERRAGHPRRRDSECLPG